MSFIVHTSGAGRKALSLAVGLRWTVLEADAKGKFSAAKIRTQGRHIGGTKYVQNPLEKTMCAYYSDPVTVTGKKSVPGAIHAVSILFLSDLEEKGIGTESAVLLMQPESLPQKRLLVMLDGGAVVVDALLDQASAVDQAKKRLAQFPETHFYSQLDETGFVANPITWELLSEIAQASKKNAASLLKPLPTSPVIPLLAGVVMVCGIGIYAWQKLSVEPEALRKAALAAQANDKTPAYVLAVDRELSSAGWDRADLGAVLSEINALPVFVRGWRLDRVECDLTACKSRWSRQGGLLTDLTSFLSDMKISLGESNIDGVVMTRVRQGKSQAWDRSKLLPIQSTKENLQPVLQTLKNAGMTVAEGEPQRWAGLNLDGVTPNAVLSRFSVDVAIPFSKATEVIGMLPTGILIKSFVLNVGDAGALSLDLKGAVYVK